MEQEAKKRFLINFLYILVIGGITVIVCRFLLYRMLPFLLSIVIAGISQRPAVFISQSLKLPKPFCAVLLSAAIYIGVAGIFAFLIWRIVLSAVGIIDYLPNVFKQIASFFAELEAKLSEFLPSSFSFDFGNVATDFLNSATRLLTEIVKKTIKTAPSFLISSIVALVAGCYISKDFDGLSKFIKSLCKKDFYQKLLRVKSIFTQSVFKILKGYLILAVITFLELWLGLTLLKIKNAYIIAALIAVVDFLPVLGVSAVMVPWTVYLALTGNAALAAGLAVLNIAVVILRNFTEPKIVSQQIGINPLFTLFSMFLGLKLFGGVGLVLFPLILIVAVKYYKEEM